MSWPFLWSNFIAAKDCDEGADELPEMSEKGTAGCSWSKWLVYIYILILGLYSENHEFIVCLKMVKMMICTCLSSGDWNYIRLICNM
jgi:hypothetical protein